MLDLLHKTGIQRNQKWGSLQLHKSFHKYSYHKLQFSHQRYSKYRDLNPNILTHLSLETLGTYPLLRNLQIFIKSKLDKERGK